MTPTLFCCPLYCFKLVETLDGLSWMGILDSEYDLHYGFTVLMQAAFRSGQSQAKEEVMYTRTGKEFSIQKLSEPRLSRE